MVPIRLRSDLKARNVLPSRDQAMSCKIDIPTLTERAQQKQARSLTLERKALYDKIEAKAVEFEEYGRKAAKRPLQSARADRSGSFGDVDR
jgi:hypothetical protein